MITRQTTTLLIASGPVFGLFQHRTSVGFISDPSGPHLQIYLDALRSEVVRDIAIADATGGISTALRKP